MSNPEIKQNEKCRLVATLVHQLHELRKSHESLAKLIYESAEKHNRVGERYVQSRLENYELKTKLALLEDDNKELKEKLYADVPF